MCKFEETLIVTFRANQPFFFWAQLLMQSTALRNDLPFESDMYSLIPLLSELLPQFLFIFLPHIDGTQRQMMCKFDEPFVFTFRAKYPFLLGTAADAKAQPFVMTYPSYSTCTH